MWSRVGHKSGLEFRCDLCGLCPGPLRDLIPHLRRSHCVAAVEPNFSLGLLYGIVEGAVDSPAGIRERGASFGAEAAGYPG